MFISNKYLMASAIVVTGGMALISPSFAHHIGNPPLLHDTGTVLTNQSQVDTGVPNGVVSGSLSTDTGTFTVEGLGRRNGVTISPDVLQSVDDLTGVSGANSSNNSATNTVDGLNPDSSNTVTVCLSEPCVPSGESTKAISLNDLAELMEDDLQNSLDDLAAAEQLQEKATDRPRRFVRRRSTNCINPAIQARKEIESKLAESQKFVEQVEQIDPENNVW